MTTKRCSRCKQSKPLSEFWRCRSKHDGLQDRCKPCVVEANIPYATSEKRRARSRLTAKLFRTSAHGIAYRKAYKKSEAGRAADRRYTQTEAGKAMLRRVYLRDLASGKRKARWTVADAIRHGKLQPAKTFKCQHCNKQAQHYHHHLGYASEHHLAVIPLCAQCHKNADSVSPKPNR